MIHTLIYKAATAALRRKKMMEAELDRLSGTRMQLETQIMTLEAANFNQETLNAMKKGSDALRVIHGNMCVCRILSVYSLSIRPF